MSDVRCGLPSQIDNICVAVIPSFNSLAFTHPAPCSWTLACWLVSVSLEVASMICVHAQRQKHVATITARFWAIDLHAKDGNAWTRFLFKLAPDAVPIGRAVDGYLLYVSAKVPMQESSQRTTIERIKKDFPLPL